MKLILHKKLDKIKEKYEKLFEESEISSAFQSFEFLKNLLSTFEFNPIIRFILKKSKIRFAEVLSDDDETILIMPINIKGNKVNPVSTYDVYDVVAGKSSDEQVLEALNFLVSYFNVDFLFNNVTKETRLYGILNSIKTAEIVSEHGCGNIACGDGGYEEYLKTLSKSSRQNLRTAYNRLEKDGHNIKMEYKFGKISSKLRKKAKNIYVKRYYEKNNKKWYSIKGLLKRFYEPVSTICAKSENAFHAFLKIDGKVSAVMSGFVHGDKIIIPRLTFNSSYSKYSPGLVLINETLKDIIFKKGYKNLDLGYGDENYKFVMGATLYAAYKFLLRR